MRQVYIKNYGIYHQYAKGSADLLSIMAYKTDINLTSVNYYSELEISIIDPTLIKREDRAILNIMSRLSINALADLGKKINLKSISKSIIYSACDSEEHNLSTLKEVVDKGNNNFWENIHYFNKLDNPLDMLRLLPTNPLYHISKILSNHEEGIPLRTASLSGMSALKMAQEDIIHHDAKQGALIINSANMLSSDILTVFSKLGEIRENASMNSGIIPSWGSAILHLDHDPYEAIAEIISIIIHYIPKVKYTHDDWTNLFVEQKNKYGTPDIIITYDNGILEQKEVESNSIEKIFPNIKVMNYKLITGYTGRLNNILDILCCLNDPEIPNGAKLLLNGTGINYGLGCVFLTKK
ncbi:hypothetical protein [Xenorhabdus littoralis]|uniref:hypothetical protein n=1 Tax=Xenorhabdus littoralis TaxID=2582835 RepID=UPI0029E7E3C6|nr:hypothetical protein [Xenorhabdus sp. psl]MDX7993228.1 hypothetical protein [Xenorhabdus sp. psl]